MEPSSSHNGSKPILPSDQGAFASSNLFLDHVGEVILSLDSEGLSWNIATDIEKEKGSSNCLGFNSKLETGIKFSDVYAVEFINWGLIHEPIRPTAGQFFLGHSSEMYRFVVHGFQRSKTRHSHWVLTEYAFGHKELHTCETWVEKIANAINMQAGRPKNLLVFIHPSSGKGNGCRAWEAVAPIFSHANVKTKVTVTKRAGHAFDVMASTPDKELNSYDGVIAVGGDGFFNEILNGLLSSRHKAPYPPAPADFIQSIGNSSGYTAKRKFSTHSSSDGCILLNDPVDFSGPSHEVDFEPLLPPESNSSGSSFFRTNLQNTDQEPMLSFPNARFRLGIIPAGSTDAIVMSTTGARDPITSALHIVLGKRTCLDVAQVVRWKSSTVPTDGPFVRYAASFFGYGFYGDVIKESEKYRWMGPKRYDVAGTKMFLKHRSYEAEVAYLDVKSQDPVVDNVLEKGTQHTWRLFRNPQKTVCCVDCVVCRQTLKPSMVREKGACTFLTDYKDSRWLKSKGRFLSVGAALISCRNDKAPSGLVADAHLSDGFLHLILVKECPRSFYLWHLTQLTRKGSNPLKYEFVEHHKTPVFTFSSSCDESVWNVDGELFQACKLSAQVFQGLISLFASGPEV